MLILPEDILAQILLNLTLGEVVALRRVRKSFHRHLPENSHLNMKVSRYLYRIISNDKTLWEYNLKREVSAQGLLLHPNRIDTSVSSVAQLESWLRCAILLRQSYSRTSKPEIMRLKLDRGITWMRIARARWCIVASSDTQQSHLSVYDFSINGKSAEVFYLPGPVITGVMDDNKSGLRLALTIGTS